MHRPAATPSQVIRPVLWDAIALAVLLVVAGCSSSAASLDEAITSLRVPADWSVLTDEALKDCELVGAGDCHNLIRTWRARGSEKAVLTALVETAEAAGYATTSEVADCRPGVSGDCTVVVRGDGVSIRLSATGSSTDDVIVASATATSATG